MLMQHIIGVGYFGYYRATACVMKHLLMPGDCEVMNEGSELGISTGSVPQLML
jgi:hypothetical protein